MVAPHFKVLWSENVPKYTLNEGEGSVHVHDREEGRFAKPSNGQLEKKS